MLRRGIASFEPNVSVISKPLIREKKTIKSSLLQSVIDLILIVYLQKKSTWKSVISFASIQWKVIAKFVTLVKKHLAISKKWTTNNKTESEEVSLNLKRKGKCFKSITVQLPYILAYKSKNFGQFLLHFFQFDLYAGHNFFLIKKTFSTLYRQ